LEVLGGHVWPDLEPVRPLITDNKAEAVNATRAAKVAANRETLQELLCKELGADDCRHAFLNLETFLTGIENFLCPCGLLIGVDFLDRAESPAHVLVSIAQRFTLLPSVIYFVRACQLARNESRRMPWLFNRSVTACSVDRAHHQRTSASAPPFLMLTCNRQGLCDTALRVPSPGTPSKKRLKRTYFISAKTTSSCKCACWAP